eukprot:CAMPEP_0205923070 /NCGR_PEP_ID=MMETSP1325-20131115/15566_1 /ASSEMBLY_ACC=CAM_ASM_000708 /TAXON_ID=236786 /ORGANISM="Florenciella sp., Strain RCC1007" /LENGTH=168 /DNA_ID=CAMNT_0053291213 /DNA_START=51 /DNA_END=557 /DNA_ORIENTATION=-
MPVKCMRASEYDYYLAPQMSKQDVQLELPISKTLKHVIERSRTLCKNVIIDGSQVGQMAVRIETDAVHVRSFFTDLRPRMENMTDEDMGNTASVKVDAKKLATVLNCYNVRHESIIMCLVDEENLVICVTLAPRATGVMTFFVPCITMDDADRQRGGGGGGGTGGGGS